MEQLFKKFVTQSKQFSNNDPSTNTEQEFKKFGTFKIFPKQGLQYRYGTGIQEEVFNTGEISPK